MKSLGKQLNSNVFFVVTAVSFLLGMSIIVLSLRFDYKILFLFVFGLPLSLLILTVLPVTVSKIRKLTTQFRWWHFLWLLVFLSGLVFRIRGADAIEQNPLDLWALYRMGLMGLVAFVLLGRLAMRKVEWIHSLFRGFIGLMTGYALVSVASTLWSVNPLWTLYKSAEYLIDVALIAAIVASIRTTRDLKTLFDWAWLLLGLLAATVWLGVLVLPEQAIQRGVGLVGIQMYGALPVVHANNVGQLGAVLGIVALTRLLFQPGHKRFYLMVLGAAMITLFLAQSRSPITGFLVALPLVLFAARQIGVLVLSVGLAVALISLTGVSDLFLQFFQRGQNPELFTSLTGRMYWWDVGWKSFKESPLIGLGAYSGARFAVLATIGFGETSHIHNTWLEIVLGVGLLGLLFVAGAFLGVWTVLLRFIFRVKKGVRPFDRLRDYSTHDLSHQLTTEAIGVLTILSVRSIFESELIWHPPLTFLLILGYAEFLRRNHSGVIHESAIRT